MANTVILRPNRDISGGTGTDYLKISETKPDGLSTTISAVSSDKDVDKTYIFGLDEFVSSKKITVKSIKIVFCCSINNSTVLASCYVGLLCQEDTVYGDFSSSDTGDGGTFVTYEKIASSESIEVLQNYVKANKYIMPDLQLQVTLHAGYSYNDGMASTKVSSVYLTQAYVEIEYEEIENYGVFDKINGTYKATTTAYKKINGAWTEISEYECKEILKNNDIRRG